MSGSDSGVLASRRGEPFNNVGGGLQMGPMASQPPPMMQNMRLGYNTDGSGIYKQIGSSSPSYHSPNGVGAGGGGADAVGDAGGGINVNIAGGGVGVGVGAEQLPVKKKRGRPRKYGPDGSMSLALTPGSGGSAGGFQSPPGGVNASGGSLVSPTVKKSRGRPRGSTNKKKRPAEALGSTGSGFTPYIISVKAGEDVSAKIMAFLQHGAKAVCILSANGAVSNVTICQPATSGGIVTYEGRFEILSLSGSFLLSEAGGQRSRTGGLSVSLSGPDGRVIGGGLAGILTAASPVQVLVGSFNADGSSARRKEPKETNQTDSFVAPSKLGAVPGNGGAMGIGSQAWGDGAASGSSDGHGSPLEQTIGHHPGLQGLSSMSWK